MTEREQVKIERISERDWRGHVLKAEQMIMTMCMKGLIEPAVAQGAIDQIGNDVALIDKAKEWNIPVYFYKAGEDYFYDFRPDAYKYDFPRGGDKS